MRIMGGPNLSRAFGFPPASSIARRTGVDACTALAIAKEFDLPLVKFGSAPSDNNVFTESTTCGRCQVSMTAQQSSVVPSDLAPANLERLSRPRGSRPDHSRKLPAPRPEASADRQSHIFRSASPRRAGGDARPLFPGQSKTPRSTQAEAQHKESEAR